MKSLTNYLYLFLFIFSTNVYAEGGVVGNGGDTLYCQNSDFNHFDGLYTLDYLLEFKKNDPLRSAKTWQESKASILKILTNLSPALAAQFKDFTDQILNKNTNLVRVWNETPLIEMDIKDENILRLLPPNCDEKKLKQTVIRTYDKNNAFYLYNKNIIEKLSTDTPLQFSFLMVHEWLWDYTKNVRALRKLNWLIHSEKFNKISDQEFFDILGKYNFFDRDLAPCDRSKIIQNLYTENCKDNTIEKLISNETLNLNSLSMPYGLRSGDFRGLFKTKKLILANNPGLLNLLAPFSFQDMKNLESLDLSNSGIQELPYWFFSDFKYVSEINLSGNLLSSIPRAFSSMPNLETIWISSHPNFDQNSLTNLPAKTRVILIK